MRSLSLESIPVNKNMKVLILLVTLLVQTSPSLSRPINPLLVSEILQDLQDMQNKVDELKPLLKAFSETVTIQTPHDIKNACECEALFVLHLKEALMFLNEVSTMDQIENILDALNNSHLRLKVKNPTDSCKFTTHKLRDASLKDDLIGDNIAFIENWNTSCKPKIKGHKSY